MALLCTELMVGLCPGISVIWEWPDNYGRCASLGSCGTIVTGEVAALESLLAPRGFRIAFNWTLPFKCHAGLAASHKGRRIPVVTSERTSGMNGPGKNIGDERSR